MISGAVLIQSIYAGAGSSSFVEGATSSSCRGARRQPAFDLQREGVKRRSNIICLQYPNQSVKRPNLLYVIMY